MSSYTFPFSSAPTKSVKHISFGILSPEEIIGNSVAKIEYVEMYENKQPKIGGLSDPRMGCVERNLKCYTCDEIINDCPGHFGHIELNAAMYHIGFIKYVKKILECICPKCSRLRILPSDPKFKKIVVSKNRFQTAWDICKSRTVCEYEDCETQLLPLRKLGYKLYYDVKKTTKNQDKIYLFADEAHKILSRMTDETCIQIGLNPKTSHPENMIITVLPVPPPCIRPSVKVDNTDNRGEDDLTSVLVNIIRCNNDLLKVKRGSDNMVSVKENLQNQIVAYIDNDLKTGIKRNVLRGSRVTKSLTSRLKGKEGRVRSNLMGKRVDFSARTVITGDPNISIEQLGVPRTIAQNLTVPIKAFNLNLDELQDMVNNSPEYPSAKYIVKVNGTRIDLRFAKRKPIVDIGDTIERHLRDGDVVLFNRQPTLHKMSMMAHTVKVMPYSTFRMNVTTTASYNADFDGDEMNVHVPQSLETIAELYELSRVSKCLVSAQSNKPVNSLVQDSVTSIRLFTLRDNFLRREEVMNLLYRIDRDVDMPPPAIFKPVPLWTGKQLFSLLMPKINMSGFHSAHPDDESGMTSIGDTRVIIQNGVLVSGIICKKTVGTSSGGILHIIFNDYGSEYAMKFLDETSQLLNEWLLHRGFSVGIGDAIIDSQVSDKMNMINQDMNEKVQDIINQYTSGELKSQGTLSVSETKESAIQTILANTRDESGRLVYKVAESRMNNVKQMIESGAKGNIMNICQISACVGQQIIQGKRISFGFKKRTLPCYEFNDDSPESRGYVKNSFLRGLSPQEMFFHAMGGREGVIDTAVKTAETGYIQRRLIKAMEDLVIKTDGTVRDSNNDIIQFQYGEDGIDGVFIEWNTFPTVLLSNDEFEKKYKGENDQEWQILVSDRNKLRDLLEKEDRIPMPLNLKRILINFENKFNERSGSSESSVSSVTADYVYEKLVNLRNLLCKRKTYLFGALLFSYLSWKQVNKFTKEQFDEILDFVHDKYDRASIPYGENVGVIAAQSIGEPATQMTLNSVEWNTQILICVNGSLQKIEIGKYIDNYFNNVSEESIKKYENNQWYTSTLEDIIEIPSCDSDGNVSWKRIEAITKHPVINEDGTDTLLKVTLASGRSVTATKGKSFLKRIDNKILPVNGSDLKIGDHLPISKSLVVSTKEEYMYFDEKFGLLCGIYLADNDTVNNEMKKWFNTKSIPIEFFQAPREFLIGLISGFFKHTTNVINNVYLLEDLRQVLKIFEFESVISISGIFVLDCLRFQKMFKCTPPTKYGRIEDNVPNVITKQWGNVTYERSALSYLEPTNTLDIQVIQNVINQDLLYDRIISIEEIKSDHPFVYDFTVQDTKNFCIFNGIHCRDTFHLSGTGNKTVTAGVPRLKELINAAKNIKTPSMTIYFQEFICYSREAIQEKLYEIEHATLENVLTKYSIHCDPDYLNSIISQDRPWLDIQSKYYKLQNKMNLYSYMVRLQLNRHELYKRKVTVYEIIMKLEKILERDVFIQASSDNWKDGPVIHVRLVKDPGNDDDNQLDMERFLNYTFKDIIHCFTISGIPGVHKAFITEKTVCKYTVDGSVEKGKKEYIIETDGINLKQVALIENVDINRIMCNDPQEVNNVYGIDIARSVLLHEIRSVITDSGSFINYRHLALLCEVMTHKGYIMSITRHGINKTSANPLTKCTFECTVDVLLDAAKNGDVNEVSGVSERILLGQVANIGTGSVNILSLQSTNYKKEEFSALNPSYLVKDYIK